MKIHTICILLISFGCCFISGWAIAVDSPLPPVGEIEKLSFVAIVNSGTTLPYTEVASVKELFLAYAAGARAVSRYREPVLTRGLQGENVFKSVAPAVVAVVVGRFDASQNFDPEGLGTGAIVDRRGYVLTNWHVVNGHAVGIVFTKPTNSAELEKAQGFGARLIYEDPIADLALLKMVSPPPTLHSLEMGDINQVQVAQDIHIVGHPHGNFWSYSTGVVSQIRDRYTWTYSDGSNHAAKVLQLQTAINPGNSGGPVVDDSGNILGLVAMSEEGQNLDYAIAADVIKRFLFLGMQMNTRGQQTSPSPSPVPTQLLSGKYSDALQVTKAVYSDAILYLVSARDGGTIGVIAKFKDGTVLRGLRPTSDGEFTFWSGDLPDGKHLEGGTVNGVLSVVSQTQSAASLAR